MIQFTSDETHQQVLDLTKKLVAEFQEATQIVGNDLQVRVAKDLGDERVAAIL